MAAAEAPPNQPHAIQPPHCQNDAPSHPQYSTAKRSSRLHRLRLHPLRPPPPSKDPTFPPPSPSEATHTDHPPPSYPVRLRTHRKGGRRDGSHGNLGGPVVADEASNTSEHIAARAAVFIKFSAGARPPPSPAVTAPPSTSAATATQSPASSSSLTDKTPVLPPSKPSPPPPHTNPSRSRRRKSNDVSLKLQKRLAASVLKGGKGKVWLDPDEKPRTRV